MPPHTAANTPPHTAANTPPHTAANTPPHTAANTRLQAGAVAELSPLFTPTKPLAAMTKIPGPTAAAEVPPP
eukprot:357208-Chlamydomonas_euryale.AAC.2